jgi:hypothetical protein
MDNTEEQKEINRKIVGVRFKNDYDKLHLVFHRLERS